MHFSTSSFLSVVLAVAVQDASARPQAAANPNVSVGNLSVPIVTPTIAPPAPIPPEVLASSRDSIRSQGSIAASQASAIAATGGLRPLPGLQTAVAGPLTPLPGLANNNAPAPAPAPEATAMLEDTPAAADPALTPIATAPAAQDPVVEAAPDTSPVSLIPLPGLDTAVRYPCSQFPPSDSFSNRVLLGSSGWRTHSTCSYSIGRCASS